MVPNRFSLNKVNLLRAITAAYALDWLAILWGFDRLGIPGYALVFFTMGLVIGGYISTIWGIIRETTPTHRLGLTSGILNPAPFLGVAAFQVLTGSIIDRAARVGDPYTLPGFKNRIWRLPGRRACLPDPVVSDQGQTARIEGRLKR